ncbi:hypothetical protein GR138_26800 [Shinella kummerowiae]|uniref:Uncharacterized protein n=1 Tax=Shinella kummerowiae TaxID=417745 RepID=A0A6N8SK26_9HYPH|nr:hypothetical protein [Shinella kummerowiae]MXN48813.1 hypothetical protein [Shinella kummerowiae]
MVYLDHFLSARDRKPKPVRKSDSEQFVSAVMDTLRDWRFSPFQNEAGTRHALRNWFIEHGHSWGLSDAEALALIGNAFDALGVKRPSWLEGQWYYTEGRTQCVWCAGDIDEEDQARGFRFCSTVCAKSALEKRYRDSQTHGDMVYQRAHYEIAVNSSPARPCKICGTMFKSRQKGAQHCSRACSRAAKGDLLANINCAECETLFRPAGRTKKYCCKECANKGVIKTREASLPPEKSCECCRVVFRPRVSFAVYCSPRCSSMMANRAYRARRAPARIFTFPPLTPAIFDGWFRRAA